MTQFNTSQHQTHSSQTPVSKIGETGDTVVYIFPGGRAQVEKGKDRAKKRKQTKSRSKVVRTSANPSHAEDRQPSSSQPVSRLATAKTTAFDLGDRLVAAGVISQTQLEVARYDQESMNLDLCDVLLARGWMTKDGLTSFLSA